ncbi:MAG: hypothetical protein AB7G88_03175 [Thermomicrobiales bacterium]
MRHTAIIISILLTLMCGFVLRQLWAMEPVNPGAIPAAPDPQIEETAKRFYLAVNDYLDGSDDIAIRNALHRDFVAHQSGSARTGTADDYLDQLESVRQLFPGIQVTPEVASVGNNIASVTLSANTRELAGFAGMRIDAEDLIGRIEFLRVERGLIIDRWSSAPIAGHLDAYSAHSIDLPFSVDSVISRVQEVTLDGFSSLKVNHLRNILLLVTAGEARVAVTEQAVSPAVTWRWGAYSGGQTETIGPGSSLSLYPMDAISLPGGTAINVWDSGDATTSLIALEFGAPLPRAISTTSSFDAFLADTLWSGIELENIDDHLTLAFGHATLLPLSVLTNERVNGVELMWVAEGSVDLAGAGGETRLRNAGGNRFHMSGGWAALAAGESAATDEGSSIRYQISGSAPASLWFFSIVPSTGSVGTSDDASDADPTPHAAPVRNPSIK